MRDVHQQVAPEFVIFGLYLVDHPTNRKWVITPVINGISRVIPLITGVIIHLLSGMSHQVPGLVNVYIANWKITIFNR